MKHRDSVEQNAISGSKRTEHFDDGQAGASLQLLNALLFDASRLEDPLSPGSIGAAAGRGVRARPGQHSRATDRQPDQSVENADDCDGSDEEQEGGRLERVRQIAVLANVARRRLRDVATERVL